MSDKYRCTRCDATINAGQIIHCANGPCPMALVETYSLIGALIWKLRCAYHFKRIGCSLRCSWECAVACWENCELDGYSDNPREAFLNEIECWTE